MKITFDENTQTYQVSEIAPLEMCAFLYLSANSSGERGDSPAQDAVDNVQRVLYEHEAEVIFRHQDYFLASIKRS